jgi:hypothetical protein
VDFNGHEFSCEIVSAITPRKLATAGDDKPMVPHHSNNPSSIGWLFESRPDGTELD